MASVAVAVAGPLAVAVTVPLAVAIVVLNQVALPRSMRRVVHR